MTRDELIAWHEQRAEALTDDARRLQVRAGDSRATSWTRRGHMLNAKLATDGAEIHRLTAAALAEK